MKKQIEFESFDGTVIGGEFIARNGSKPKAAVLLLHGCPSYMDEYGFYSNEESDLYPNGGMVEIFEKNNIASLRFNYRDQYKDAFAENMNNLSISGMISDTEAAYWKLIELVNEDAPIYVVATSFAAGFAPKWINTYDRKIDKLFLMCPLLDISFTLSKRNAIDLSGRYPKLNDQYKNELMKQGWFISGGKKVSSAFANECMQINYLQEFSLLRAKTYLFHGNIDTFVPISQSKEVTSKYTHIKLYEFIDSGHGFVAPWDKGLPDDYRLEFKAKNLNEVYRLLLEEINE